MTAADLDALGISYPEWAGGAPPMEIVVSTGNFAVSGVSFAGVKPERVQTKTLIQVIDTRAGLATVTLLTDDSTLINRVVNYKQP